MKRHSRKAYGGWAAAVGAIVSLATVGTVVALAGNARGVETTVRVVEKEMTTSVSPAVVKAGRVTLVVRNGGTVEHELVVLVGVGKLAVQRYKAVETTKLGEVEGVDPGKTKSFTLTLKPGKYTLLCNVAGHYMLGMHTVLTVR